MNGYSCYDMQDVLEEACYTHTHTKTPATKSNLLQHNTYYITVWVVRGICRHGIKKKGKRAYENISIRFLHQSNL